MSDNTHELLADAIAGLAVVLRKWAAEPKTRTGDALTFDLQVAADNLELLLWIPGKEDNNDGWNRCVDRIKGHRAGKTYTEDTGEEDDDT